MTFDLSLTYNDIGLRPTMPSTVVSRSEVNLSGWFGGIQADFPIILSPMETVCSMAMVLALRDWCVPVALPRTSDFERDVAFWRECAEFGCEHVFPSVSTKVSNEQLLHYAGASAICIDVANGYHTAVSSTIQQICNVLGDDILIMTGNVASVQGYEWLGRAHANAVRVGIGNGSVCSTSVATGIGVGQASLLRDIQHYHNTVAAGPYVVADGGVKTPGDIAKALALGADYVMIGSMFAGTDEAPGEIIEVHGHYYKRYAGQASKAVKRSGSYVEGVETLVPYVGSVAGVMQRIEDGLTSAMSYMDALQVSDFIGLPDECFVRLSHGAQIERSPHAKVL